MTFPHEDTALFKESVNFTQSQTGFIQRLIEKDYFLSLALGYISDSLPSLVFKGGTCLAKVHAGFYRLSEDLDFMVSVPVNASKGFRSKAARPFRQRLSEIARHLPFFVVQKTLTGANNSSQYIGTIEYKSILTGEIEPIKIEISLREPLIEPVFSGKAKTILLDPIRGQAVDIPVEVSSIANIEAYAEKFRAAMTRKEPAIRDFFDIWYAVKKNGLNLDDKRLRELIKIKINSPEKNEPELGINRIDQLKRQIAAQLRPVLREVDYSSFDFDASLNMVNAMMGKVK